MPYDYNQQRAVNAGVPGAGDLRNPNFVAEGDWALFTTLENGLAPIGTIYKIPVAPNCPYRKIYLSIYPDQGGTPQWYQFGIFRAKFSGRVVYDADFTFGSTNAQALSGQITGAQFQPTLQTGAGSFNSEVGDRIMYGRIGQTVQVQLPPIELYVVADELSFEIMGGKKAATDNTGVFFACKSMQANA